MSTQITTGSFVNVASTPFFIPLEQQINRFVLRNLTRSGITALGVSGSLTSTRIVEAYFNPVYAAGTALIRQNGTVSGILAPLNNGICAINGFTIFNASTQANGPNVSGASFVPGQPTVFTAAAHGFQVGDNVRIVNVTSAPQIAGLTMTVTAVTTNTFTTLLDTTNALTSVFTVYKVGNANLPMRSLYYPENRVVAKITQANPMVVTTLVQQNYQVGDVVRFAIPTAFGMQQLNSTTNGLPLQFTVSSVNNAIGTQTVTFANTDSTNFTALVSLLASQYPTSFPQMIPQGEGNTNNLLNVVPTPLPYGNQNILGFTKQNQGFNGILIGAGDGTNSATTGGIIGSTADAWEWEATTALQSFPNNT
jgi:hypothetical protein